MCCGGRDKVWHNNNNNSAEKELAFSLISYCCQKAQISSKISSSVLKMNEVLIVWNDMMVHKLNIIVLLHGYKSVQVSFSCGTQKIV